MFTGEEIKPHAAVGRAEEVVLNYHCDEKPEDDAAADYTAVEGGDAAGGLAVVVWKAEV